MQRRLRAAVASRHLERDKKSIKYSNTTEYYAYMPGGVDCSLCCNQGFAVRSLKYHDAAQRSGQVDADALPQGASTDAAPCDVHVIAVDHAAGDPRQHRGGHAKRLLQR